MNLSVPTLRNDWHSVVRSAIPLLLVVMGNSYPSNSQIHVLSSSRNLLEFEAAFCSLSVRTCQFPEGTFTCLDLDPCETGSEPGHPQLPFRIVDVGLPPRGIPQIKWQVRESAAGSVEYPVVPSPEFSRRGGPVVWMRKMDPVVYARTTAYPQDENVTIGPVTIVRGVRRIRIKIYPVIYRPATQAYTWTKKMSFQIEFPRDGSGKMIPAGENFFHKNLINSETALGWHLGRRRGVAKRMLTDFWERSTPRYRILVGDRDETDFSKDGIYAVTGKWLTDNGVDVSGVNSAHIAMYAGSGRELEPHRPLSSDPGAVKSIPIQVRDGGDGSFDAGDTILFYGQGTSAWAYDTTDSLFEFALHRYTNRNVYWLSLEAPLTDAKRMGRAARIRLPSPVTPVTSVPAYTRIEKNQYAIMDTGGTWYWKALSNDPKSDAASFAIPYSVPDPVPDVPGSVRLFGNTFSSFTVLWDGENLACQEKKGFVEGFPDSIKTEGEITVHAAQDTLHFDGITLRYQRRLRLHDRRMSFFGLPGRRDTRFQVDPDGALGSLHCFRICDKWNVDFLDEVDGAGGAFFIDDSAPGGDPYLYLVEGESRFRTPSSVEEDRLPNGEHVLKHLRNPSNFADWVIISPDSFVAEAERLAAHRKANRIDSVDHPVVVRLSDVFDEFGGGLRDPMAVRDFLYYAYHEWSQAPVMVIFFGDGSVDHKGYRFSPAGPFPVFIHEKVCMDDFFTYLEPNPAGDGLTASISLVAGRIPAANAEEAAVVVNKILEVEDPSRADWGPWRQRVILAADDDMQLDLRDSPAHTVQSERVAQALDSVNKALEVGKVYLFDYTMNARFEFPDATRDLLETMNRGSILVNYVGHGGVNMWASERLLHATDAELLQNRKKYPILFSASCSVGRFDDPVQRSFNEAMICVADRGAVAAVAATRETYGDDNNSLNKAFVRYLVGKENASAGKALFMAKLSTAYPVNKAKYLFFGDPALQYWPKPARIVFDKAIDSLKARQTCTVRGTVRANGKTDETFKGQVLVQVYKGAEHKVHHGPGSPSGTAYTISDDLIFSGQTSVKAGSFQQSFLIPTKINYGQAEARLTAFAWDDNNRSALGAMDSIYTGGTAAGLLTDGRGPVIRFALADSFLTGGTEFDDRAEVTLPLELAILLEDSMGIDVTSRGPDEGLCIAVPGFLEKTNINSKFKYAEGDFRRGRAVYYFEPGSMPPGEHELQVTARDGLGNLSAKSLHLLVKDDSTLVLSDVFNYPNPFPRDTRFYYKLSRPADVTLKIFTRSGKLIRVIEHADNPQIWDGYDQAGNRVANNMYFYKITATSQPDPLGRSFSAEAVEKLMVVR